MNPRALQGQALLRGAAIVALALAAWEAASRLGWLSPFSFPPPSRVAEGFMELATIGFPDGIRLAQHLVVTVTRIVEGFIVAMVLAIPLGLLIGRTPVLDRLLAPIVVFARSIATLSLLPLAIVWFGIGEGSKIFLIGYACFWVMLSNTIAAAKYVDPILLRAARTMDIAGLRLFFRILLPATLPRLLAGARVALGVGFMVIVGAEMIATVRGLGALIMEARNFYRTDISLVGMAALGLLGVVLTTGLAALEARLLPWQRGLEGVRR
ncbi:ABC transporter permease [Vineibacter terrae]|uniref:ABC transporter permease n=1 Tax=Vineibacter terrae TaxID=2586908 RepID=UPI002E3011ED|nr:ABC transporter permease [Vineibacter terrae]HEX2885202.1 ABC transporter permease [Vineibacter terrae]